MKVTLVAMLGFYPVSHSITCEAGVSKLSPGGSLSCSSNLPQYTCLEVSSLPSKTLISWFKRVYLGLELKFAGHWQFRNRIGHPSPKVTKFTSQSGKHVDNMWVWYIKQVKCPTEKCIQVKLSFIVITLHVWTYSGTKCRASQDHGAT